MEPIEIIPKKKTHEEQAFALIRQVWGKGKKNGSKGYHWISGHFGQGWTNYPERQMERILYCLESKRDGVECPEHKRIHDGK